MTERKTSSRGGPDAQAGDPQRPKQPYIPPKIVDYGSTSKLSAAKPGSNTDGANTIRKTCL